MASGTLTKNLDKIIGMPITVRCESITDNKMVDELLTIVKYDKQIKRSQQFCLEKVGDNNILQINFGPFKKMNDSELIRTFDAIEASCRNGSNGIKKLLDQLPWQEPDKPNLGGKDRAYLSDLRKNKKSSN